MTAIVQIGLSLVLCQTTSTQTDHDLVGVWTNKDPIGLSTWTFKTGNHFIGEARTSANGHTTLYHNDGVYKLVDRNLYVRSHTEWTLKDKKKTLVAPKDWVTKLTWLSNTKITTDQGMTFEKLPQAPRRQRPKHT